MTIRDKFRELCQSNVDVLQKVYVFGTAISADLAAMAWQEFKDQHAVNKQLHEFETHIIPFRFRGAWMLIVVRNVCRRMSGEAGSKG